MTPRKLLNLLSHNPSKTYIQETLLRQKLLLLGFNNQYAQQIINQYRLFFEKRLGEQYEERGVFILTVLDSDYPALLKEIVNPPTVLYCMGHAKILNGFKKRLAVVGSRTPSSYGLSALKHFIPPLLQHQFSIVSGLARGIDKQAHEVTISSSGHTIAVLGNGFNHSYPRENRLLQEHISKHHLLLSEYPPFFPPQKWYFPERNRIISGLCWGTLIVESKEKSGSLITATCALEQGREVFAVPGSILSPLSKGPHLLIQEGAKLVREVDDIIAEITQFS